MRICKGCNKEKPLDQYHTYKKRNGDKAHYYKCKECHKEYGRRWIAKDDNRAKRNKKIREERKANPDLQRKYKFKTRYNLTLEEYNNLKEKQEFKCAICNILEKDCHESLNVDHCHNTGKVRGLLCQYCNVGLGKFKDNTEFLKKAIEYLRKNG